MWWNKKKNQDNRIRILRFYTTCFRVFSRNICNSKRHIIWIKYPSGFATGIKKELTLIYSRLDANFYAPVSQINYNTHADKLSYWRQLNLTHQRLSNLAVELPEPYHTLKSSRLTISAFLQRKWSKVKLANRIDVYLLANFHAWGAAWSGNSTVWKTRGGK